jgi:phosphatidylglycerophosphatase A
MKFKRPIDFLTILTCTVFGVGYLPFAPGTFGSVVGLGLFSWLVGLSAQFYFLFILGVIVLGLLTCGRMEKLTNRKDPGCIVIDEVAGMLLALSFMPPDPKIIFLGFLIFRILDTLKPYPSARFQNQPGAIGVIGDDLIAGIYTNIVLQLILKIPH